MVQSLHIGEDRNCIFQGIKQYWEEVWSREFKELKAEQETLKKGSIGQDIKRNAVSFPLEILETPN